MLDENQVLHHTKWAMNFKWYCGCVRQWSHCFLSISPIGLCFWVFKMFFYDSYLILDHNQVYSSWILIEHLTISVSNSAPVCFSNFHCTHTYCLRFFMTHCLVQILIWIFPRLANIKTKNTKKKNHSKMLSTKKRIIPVFTFFGAVVSGILCFTIVLCDL